MKKIILKVLNTVVYYVACTGVGGLLGFIANLLLTKFGVSEESWSAHPVRSCILTILAWLFIIVVPGFFVVLLLLAPIKEFFDEKIDDMDDDPFEK